MMSHYEMSRALSDQHIRDLVAAARRHCGSLTAPSSRHKDVTARMLALLHMLRGARAHSTVTSTSGAGPMGCCA
jgi:hypothetical protein